MIRTRAIIGAGTYFQAECSCGWLANRSFKTQAAAKRDWERHKEEYNANR